jgi:hypothetical protein
MNPSDAFFELKRQFAVATMNYARAVEETKDVAASIGVSLSRDKLQEFTECIQREASARQLYDRAKEKFLRRLEGK